LFDSLFVVQNFCQLSKKKNEKKEKEKSKPRKTKMKKNKKTKKKESSSEKKPDAFSGHRIGNFFFVRKHMFLFFFSFCYLIPTRS